MFYDLLAKHRQRPAPFAHFDTAQLWTEDHISRKMLELHLDDSSDLASRPTRKIDSFIAWVDEVVGLRDKRILDLGCGPGLYASRMARRGARVTGLDFSSRSIAYATGQMADGDISYLCRDYLQDDLPDRNDLVLLIYCDICALPPHLRHRILTKIRNSLNPGGQIILDVFSEPQFNARAESSAYDADLMGGFWSPHPYFGFQSIFLYPEQSLALDRYLIIEENRTWEVFNWLEYFTPQKLRQELEQAGFHAGPARDIATGQDWIIGESEFAIIAD